MPVTSHSRVGMSWCWSVLLTFDSFSASLFHIQRLLLCQLNRDAGVVKTGHGVLLKSLTQSDSGLYHCLATENKFKHTVARVALRILDREIVDALTAPDVPSEEHRPHLHPYPPPPPPPPQTVPPQFHPEPEVRLINQYCQSYWQQIQASQQSKRTSRRHVASHNWCVSAPPPSCCTYPGRRHSQPEGGTMT